MCYVLSRSRVRAGTVECVVCCLGPDPKPELHGDNRTYRVWLDPNQYQMDMTQTVKGVEVRLVLPLLGMHLLFLVLFLVCFFTSSSFTLSSSSLSFSSPLPTPSALSSPLLSFFGFLHLQLHVNFCPCFQLVNR